jgi:putative addiction module component (TIGR02574 family)
MTRAAQEILDQAMQLPEDDRDFIADSLWRSVRDGAGDQALEEQWAEELDRRRQQARSGEVRMIPHEEVMASLRARRNP